MLTGRRLEVVGHKKTVSAWHKNAGSADIK
jgi:hypothetical protein